MPTSPFNPDPATTDAILQSIAAEYSLSLTDIAAQHQTTIEALTAWLTREDIDERLTAIESACARRARLTAANHLPAVAHVAKQALEEASDVLRLPPDYRTHHSIALRIRATESARKAAALLLRIANFTPGPRRTRHHAAPTSQRLTVPPATITVIPTECAHAAPATASGAEIEPSTSPSAPPTESASAAPAAEYPINRVQSATICDPQTQIAPKTSPSAPPTESTHAAPILALRAESTPSAPTDNVASDRALSAPTAATPTDRAQSAPRALPPPESTPSEPISATSSTSAARTPSAPHAAPPRHASNSPAIPAWFTLVKPSAVPAPRWSPAPQSHPPPRKPTAETTRASFTPA